GWDAPRPLAPRRVEPAERPAPAAREVAHRPLREACALHHRLKHGLRMSDIEPRPSFGIEYADAPESTSVVSIASRYELYIGGAWTAPADGEYLPSLNPATEETHAEVAVAGPADIDAAFQAARAAFPAWAGRPAKDR